MRLILISVLALASCGPLAQNTDKPTGLRDIASAGGSTGDYGVKTATHAPNGGVQLTGVACKNMMWDADPTNASAISTLKREAHNAGYNSVFVTGVAPDPAALTKNCWTAIVATGVAFNS